MLLHALIVMLGAYNLPFCSVLSFFSVILLYPLFCLLIKRSHDGGKSGWFSPLWFFVFLVAWFIISAAVQNIMGGEILREMNAKTIAAMEAGDWGAIVSIAETYAEPLAKKINVAMGFARFVGLMVTAVLINMMIGVDNQPNKYGPASQA